VGRSRRQGTQEAQGAEDPEPARPYERSRADLYRPGRTLHPPDRRDDGSHRHEGERGCREEGWRHCQEGAC